MLASGTGTMATLDEWGWMGLCVAPPRTMGGVVGGCCYQQARARPTFGLEAPPGHATNQPTLPAGAETTTSLRLRRNTTTPAA